MLMTQKAFARAGMLNYFCTLQIDKSQSQHLDEQRRRSGKIARRA